MPRRFLIAIPLAASLLAGCLDTELETASAPQALNGGIALADNVAPFDSVVLLDTFPGGPSFCVATKIGAHRFLTSAACLDYYPVEQTITLSNRLDGLDEAKTHAISSEVAGFDRHPSFDLALNHGVEVAQRRGYDLAIIDIVADTPEIPVMPVRTGYLDSGTRGVVVGFGCIPIPPGPDDDEFSLTWFEFHKQVVPILTRGADTLRAGVTWSDEQVTSAYTSYSIASGALRPCFGGDRGGPLLVQDAGGAWQVAGVTGYNSDVDLTWFSRVGSAARWIANPGVNDLSDGSSGWLINGKSDLCIGVGSTGPDALAAQFFCDGRQGATDNQSWTLVADHGLFKIKNGKSGKCLRPTGPANGAAVEQYACSVLSTTTQRDDWQLMVDGAGKVRMRNAKVDRCLGVPGGSKAPGTGLATYTCDGFANQGWIFSR